MDRAILALGNLLTILILVDVVASWIPSLGRSELIVMLRRVTDPILQPFRRIVPPESLGIDISPIFAILAIRLLTGFLASAF